MESIVSRRKDFLNEMTKVAVRRYYLSAEVSREVPNKREVVKVKTADGKKERVSCRAAMRSIFSRWQLNQRAFASDPDVFILRKTCASFLIYFP